MGIRVCFSIKAINHGFNILSFAVSYSKVIQQNTMSTILAVFTHIQCYHI